MQNKGDEQKRDEKIEEEKNLEREQRNLERGLKKIERQESIFQREKEKNLNNLQFHKTSLNNNGNKNSYLQINI